MELAREREIKNASVDLLSFFISILVDDHAHVMLDTLSCPYCKGPKFILIGIIIIRTKGSTTKLVLHFQSQLNQSKTLERNY